MTTPRPSARSISASSTSSRLDRPEVRPREDGLADCAFLPLDQVAALRSEFETWSQICLEGFLLRGTV